MVFFKKIIFQNRYVALETPSRLAPPFMANAILNFHFDFPHPSLTYILNDLMTYWVLNEVIGSLLLCGVISISLLLVSRYSKLESDRSRFQIYNNIKKEYAAFRAAELVDNRDILDFFRDEQGPEEDEHK